MRMALDIFEIAGFSNPVNLLLRTLLLLYIRCNRWIPIFSF